MGKITINELEIDVIRAWKDEEYRNSLSEEQRSQLPENPAGDLSDTEMEALRGGVSDLHTFLGKGLCPGNTFRGCPTKWCTFFLL